jgi:hypothetical protein
LLLIRSLPRTILPHNCSKPISGANVRGPYPQGNPPMLPADQWPRVARDRTRHRSVSWTMPLWVRSALAISRTGSMGTGGDSTLCLFPTFCRRAGSGPTSNKSSNRVADTRASGGIRSSRAVCVSPSVVRCAPRVPRTRERPNRPISRFEETRSVPCTIVPRTLARTWGH